MFICILGLLAMSLWSTSAFAQATVTVSSTPETTGISTGHTEVAGQITLQSLGTGGIGAGSSVLTVDYRVPITVPATTVPGGTVTAQYITICGLGALAPPVPITVNGCTTAYSYSSLGTTGTYQIGGANQNQLLISLPPSTSLQPGQITINGVKVSLNGYAPTVLTASLGISSPPPGTGTYSIIAGQNLTDVISSIQPAFTQVLTSGTTAVALSGAPAAANTGTGQLLSTTTVSDRFFNIDVPETFVDAFQATLGQNGYLNDPVLTFTFNNIPNGVFLNFLGHTTGTSNALCAAATGVSPTDQAVFYNTNSGLATAIPNTSLSVPIVSNAANATTISFTGLPFNLTQPEAIRLRGCIYTSGAVSPLATGTPITVSVTMSPNGSALAAGTQIQPVIGNFPRYQSTLVSATVATIIAPETDMLISFAARNTSGFDTGIAVANTSVDPFGTNGAAPNDGVITLNFYPQGSGTAFTYTTGAGSPGLGLSSTGNLVGGKTWSVGLSELLAAIPGAPTSFTGYIFVRAAFTNAHGAAYVTDYRGFTSASPFVIVPIGNRATTNENLNQ
jgi:hypothetical protein